MTSSIIVARYDFAAQAERSVDARNHAAGEMVYRMEQDPELGNWVVVCDRADVARLAEEG